MSGALRTPLSFGGPYAAEDYGGGALNAALAQRRSALRLSGVYETYERVRGGRRDRADGLAHLSALGLGALNDARTGEIERVLAQLDADEQALADEVNQLVASGDPTEDVTDQHELIVNELVDLNATSGLLEDDEVPSFLARAATAQRNITNLKNRLVEARRGRTSGTEISGVVLGAGAVLGAGLLIAGLTMARRSLRRRRRR